VTQRVGRGIALLFHDRGARRGWVLSSTLRPTLPPGKDPVPIWQEAGWAPGPVWIYIYIYLFIYIKRLQTVKNKIPTCVFGIDIKRGIVNLYFFCFLYITWLEWSGLRCRTQGLCVTGWEICMKFGQEKKKTTLGNLCIGHRQRKVEIIERFAISRVLTYVSRTDWYIWGRDRKLIGSCIWSIEWRYGLARSSSGLSFLQLTSTKLSFFKKRRENLEYCYFLKEGFILWINLLAPELFF